MPEDHQPHDVLARITGTPQLARAVPLLRPDVLHAVIAHYGLHDSGPLIALATPQQLSALFDLDLWKAPRSGAVEQFDPARFLEWLEVLVEADPAIAADRLARQDAALVVAGLSPSITVWDPAVFSPDVEPTGADVVVNAVRERGAHVHVGGYLVVARRSEAWDAIVQVLVALEEHEPATFHRVMRACRRLSDSGHEDDGLDDLLPEAQQQRLDLSLGREARRDRLGYLPPEQARAFLDAARGVSLAARPPGPDAVFIGYMRTVAPSVSSETPADLQSGDVDDGAPAEAPAHVAEVIEALRGAGVIVDPRRALPHGGQEPSAVNTAFEKYLESQPEEIYEGWMAREQALGFLANALVAGCSVQGRAFTPREAGDAVVATCNLGLECWPQHWPTAATQDLVTVFRVGWAVLQGDVSMVAARRLLDALGLVQTSDRDLQFGLRALARELRKHAKAGAPWRARDRLEVLASLDLPAWAALTALLDECPVMLANVSAPHDKRPHALDPSAFQFIAEAAHVAAVHEFLRSLPEVLTS